MKICNVCKAELPEDYFHKNAAMKDGLERYCKECRKQRDRLKPTPSARKRMVNNLVKQLKPTDY